MLCFDLYKTRVTSFCGVLSDEGISQYEKLYRPNKTLNSTETAKKAIIASLDVVGYQEVTLLVPHSAVAIALRQRDGPNATLSNFVTLLMPHSVSSIMLEQKAHSSPACWLTYNNIVLPLPDVRIKHCTAPNPAALLSATDDGEPCDCLAAIAEGCSPTADTQETPLPSSMCGMLLVLPE